METKIKPNVSTLSYIPGKEIKEVIGIVIAWDEDFVVGRHIFNVDESINRAYEKLLEKAESAGGNAVLGCSLTYDSSSKIPIVQGTAVVVE